MMWYNDRVILGGNMSCNCNVATAQEVVDKVKTKGVDTVELETTFSLKCQCGNTVEMTTHLTTCPNCETIFAVTPCKSDDINNVVMLVK